LMDSATIRGVFWRVRLSFPGKRVYDPELALIQLPHPVLAKPCRYAADWLGLVPTSCAKDT
jgi:hypothetical protein